jgi:hypothetical protein
MRDKLKGKIDEIKEAQEKQDRENKKLTLKFAAKKEEYEDSCKRVK